MLNFREEKSCERIFYVIRMINDISYGYMACNYFTETKVQK